MTSESRPSSGSPAVRRVLVECDDPTIQDGLERILRESGYIVSLCAGPASRSSGCPLLATGECGLVESAEVVVHALDPGNDAHQAVLAALTQSCPDIPIIVEADVSGCDQASDVRRVRFPMSRAALLNAIEGERA